MLALMVRGKSCPAEGRDMAGNVAFSVLRLGSEETEGTGVCGNEGRDDPIFPSLWMVTLPLQR